MAINPNMSDLDPMQALRRCVDATDDTLRVEVGSATGLAIEIDAATGDNIAALSKLYSGAGSISSTELANDIVVASIDVSNTTTIQLFAEIVAGVTGTAAVKIQISPVAVGDVWIDSGVSLNVTGAVNLKSAQVADLAMRARAVVSSTSISVGSSILHLLARS